MGKAAVAAGRAPYSKIEKATSGAIPSKIATNLLKEANKIGGVGSKGVNGKNVVGTCAEFHAAHKVLLKNPLVNVSQVQTSVSSIK